MKIIVPMAGRGSRLRPHTLTIPKPLVPVAGVPIVERLVTDLVAGYSGKVDEIAFIIGDFGDAVVGELKEIASRLGAKGSVYYQDEPLGTAHAILCAKESMRGPCLVAFADTLFQADFNFDASKDGFIWVKRVEDPKAYGVVKLHDDGHITDFVEKPEEFVSDMAIVGIYYFKDGDRLRDELQYLLDNNIKDKGEFQLTNALENMKSAGVKFYPAEIKEWLDCGNKKALVHANQRVLEMKKSTDFVDASATITNSVIKQPCYIGAGAVITDSVVGPHVSIGAGSQVNNSVLQNTVVQLDSQVNDVVLKDAMIGNKATVKSRAADLSVGDYSEVTI